MKVRELDIPGAWEIIPQLHSDSRGLFFEWLTEREFTGFAGHRLRVRQANCSVSQAGALRGLHFAQLPPSQAKYVTCVSGSVFDVVVDIRLGSPTYGRWASVVLDAQDHRSVYISEGLAHGFLALQDNSTVVYLCSTEYNPQREYTICATDPQLRIDWPGNHELVLSERDAAAPTLKEVEASGLLPTWEATRAFVEQLRGD
ncbi:dTDP-4-dehydrorhamnose 3,5-epimerase [Mycobacterium shimoidei]|uniref:dTDP-4-dehydrorhamnose 3,5-epimerase n=1 Tax=Mycobacterium shimoidei TaxID=29313 RepID=A0A1E3TJ78_MYCSH|nr:dTDP-4-dehydrorhamnose 3,5-epimerase [Mycobacterium shimoidei]MCV7260559.1 dTDP-4-dehydrorhamnose 3,5-epimerase [Mycobacterium shimoidei]ODR13715.1 dTDP-4-dehydrorhamnose 3,5-epimerase [Mycobacterium shimoidei]ORW76273.1 dTDP-4-dehydrorhamnose 3,5-epimerase [Mycobacterium shimoidei]SRX91976.1 dTDP-4-dehydrorhamnose 3,5-epimerase RmlC (dTDP-4-keto-6-deoxyglucose 3,5-epimerase) (dTDP-L-rhamnose synthetase) (thymidine diphospho-4-keto-rhamnose 3,5-epimerase) [Mycobacterium tuberculosis H37Rv] [